ncbi:TPA: hypothetical protein RZK55_001717 [Campylobacter jejuni]|nr:hypothetical protein [Campylobacter jejuni]
MLAPPPITSAQQPKALSLGVSNYSPWDLEMADMSYCVLQYDGFIEKGPYNHPNIIFHKKFIKKYHSEDSIILQEILSQYAFDQKHHNILQCDIETYEWEMLESVDMELLSKYFSQIIFEFHKCYPDQEELSYRKFSILSKINQYYSSIWANHPNGGRNYYSKGLIFSDLIEVSYLRKDIAKIYENNGYRTSGNLKGLDYPNNPTRPSIPVKF